jgi:hypothetical protein
MNGMQNREENMGPCNGGGKKNVANNVSSYNVQLYVLQGRGG